MWTRRQVLTAGAGAAALSLERSSLMKAVPAAASEVGKVKILDVKAAAVELTYYPARLVKIVTDSELYGLGEAHSPSVLPSLPTSIDFVSSWWEKTRCKSTTFTRRCRRRCSTRDPGPAT